ncbi:MAG: MotA/TolQ/ExbB proton channel family protein [Phycisphaerales bacterium]|nr:MotA/TolQ/ExbB proton channel family protein [Phycisphaerales bacterium]
MALLGGVLALPFSINRGLLVAILDPLAGTIVFGGTAAAGLILCGFAGLAGAARAVVTPGLTKPVRRQAIRELRLLASSAGALGVVGTLLSMVWLLSNLGDPSEVGPGIAASLLTLLYGTALSAVLLLASFLVSRREPAVHSDTRAAAATLWAGGVTASLCVVVVLISFAALRSFFVAAPLTPTISAAAGGPASADGN